MMYLPVCPECGKTTVRELDRPKMLACECGTVWRMLTSDIHYAVNDSNRGEIRKVVDATLQAYHVKNEDINRSRELRRQKAVDYLVDEVLKGPIVGGTMAEPSSVCSMFGSDVWSALQKAVLIRDGMCMICGQRPSAEVHHIRPRHLKGKDHPRNLIGLCLECHDEVHRIIDDGIQSVLESSLKINLPKFQMRLDDLEDDL